MSKKVRMACVEVLGVDPNITDDDLIQNIQAVAAIANTTPVTILITAHANGYQTLNVSGTNDRKLIIELVSRALTKVASTEAPKSPE